MPGPQNVLRVVTMGSQCTRGSPVNAMLDSIRYSNTPVKCINGLTSFHNHRDRPALKPDAGPALGRSAWVCRENGNGTGLTHFGGFHTGSSPSVALSHLDSLNHVLHTALTNLRKCHGKVYSTSEVEGLRNARHSFHHVRGRTVMCPSLVGLTSFNCEADTNDESPISHLLSDRTG
jgi:hypothetical protein